MLNLLEKEKFMQQQQKIWMHCIYIIFYILYFLSILLLISIFIYYRTFQTPKLLRKLTMSGTGANKQPILEIDLQIALCGLDLTFDQFVDLCILCGCDYCSSIKGIGPKTALKLIRQYKNLEGIIQFVKRDRKKKYQLPKDWTSYRIKVEDPTQSQSQSITNSVEQNISTENQQTISTDNQDNTTINSNNENETVNTTTTNNTPSTSTTSTTSLSTTSTTTATLTDSKLSSSSVETETLPSVPNSQQESMSLVEDNSDDDDGIQMIGDDDEDDNMEEEEEIDLDDDINEEDLENTENNSNNNNGEQTETNQVDDNEEGELIEPMYLQARKLFHNHEVIDASQIELKWLPPQEEELRKFLVERMGFNPERVENGIKKLVEAQGKKSQQRLDKYKQYYITYYII